MPDTQTKPPDIYALIALDRGCPAGWRPFWMLSIGETREGGSVMMRGAIPGMFTKGPRKGEPNWQRRDRSTERELVVTNADLDARLAQWERETGLCGNCGGSGQAVYAYDCSENPDYHNCKKCNATGRAA